jgi:hypothetical protein
MRSIAGRLRFQPSRSAPSLPHQAPAERGENTGIPKASKPRKSLRLDPLENTIDVKRTSPITKEEVGVGGEGAVVGVVPTGKFRENRTNCLNSIDFGTVKSPRGDQRS